MIGQTTSPIHKLYDQDYQIWLETTLEQLRNGQYYDVDWDNLLAEIEGMTRSDKRKLMSLLTRLFEHFLKLVYWEAQREYNQAGWKGEIQNFRIQIKRLLKDSPSLKPYLTEILEECYVDAVKIAQQKMVISPQDLPPHPIANLEQILDNNWFPVDNNLLS